MNKKLLLSFLLFTLSSTTQAITITCPSVEQIKQHQYTGWLPLYIAGEELISQQDLENFANHVKTLLIARWNKNYLENAHCFYFGDSDLIQKITFAQDAWQPSVQAFWQWKTPKQVAECVSANPYACQFIK